MHHVRELVVVLDKREQVAAVQVPLDDVHRFVGDEQQVEVPRSVAFRDFDELPVGLLLVS